MVKVKPSLEQVNVVVIGVASFWQRFVGRSFSDGIDISPMEYAWKVRGF